MTTALLKASTLVVMPSDSSGEPVLTSARNIEVSGAPDFSDTYDSIERNVNRQAFSTYAPLRGLETTSASITVELHGSGECNKAPESALLYKAVFGALIGPVAGDPWENVDDTLSTTTSSALVVGDYVQEPGTSPEIYKVTIPVSSTTGFQVGFPLRIHSAGVIKTIGFIVSITDGTSLEIITENNAAISSGDTVDCGYLFSLKNLDQSQVLATPEVNADYFRGDITKEHWTGLSGTSMEIDFSTGQICLPAFSFEGAEIGYDSVAFSPASYTGINTTFDSENTSPLVVQLADIFMINQSSNEYFQECISNIQLNITNEVFKKQCIATTGIGEVIRTSRACTGSLNTFYTNKDFQVAFKNDTQYTLRGIFNYAKSLDANGTKVFDTTSGNIVAISIPQLKFSDVSVAEESGIFKYTSSFSCEPNTGDDELLLAFL